MAEETTAPTTHTEGAGDNNTLPYTEAWLTGGPDSHTFYTRTYSPPPSTATPTRAVLIFVHGFGDHVGRYEHVHPWYAERGMTVFAYDQRGFGRTALGDVKMRSKNEAYGKTSWEKQLGDLEWWVQDIGKKYEGIPLFLMGHSMGGGVVCAFATRTSGPPKAETLKMLSGVVVSSPLLHLTHPKPKIVTSMGAQIGRILPHMSIPADVNHEYLSRNPVTNKAHKNDPYIKYTGTLKGIGDMLSGGEKLVEEDWKHWPNELGVLFLHGTEDHVTSYKATEMFCERIGAVDKKVTLYPEAYHEMVNEIDGIPEKMFEEIVGWIEQRIPPRSRL